ncbi:MAG: ATP-dependent protease [Aquificae bacterium]|nr:ATP-dependent protease [Aquificota bacterium]
MREFVDKERPASEKLKEILERYRYDIPSLISALKKLIEEDPYYLETYVYLSEILENEGYIKEAEEVLLEAYNKAMELIRDENGNLPDRLPWKHETNRHIIKALLETGIMFWELGELEKALDVLKLLYKLDPEDPVGVRYYILAILQNMGFEEFELTFGKNGGYDTRSLEEWFKRNEEVFRKFINT